MGWYSVDVRVEARAVRKDASQTHCLPEGWDSYHQGELVDGTRTCIFEREVVVEADDTVTAKAEACRQAPAPVCEGWEIEVTETWPDALAFELSGPRDEGSTPSPL